MLRLILGAMLAVAPPTPLQGADREVSIDSGTGRLFASEQLPNAAVARGPAVLIISGSGAADRDGNTGGTSNPNELRQLADALGAAGIVSLRFDKRGVGKSALALHSEQDLTLNAYVEDAVQWARWLAAQPGVTCVVIAGHSEGSLIALLAAKRVSVCGIVSLEGPGRRLGVILREQLDRVLPEPLRNKANDLIAQLEAGKRVAQVDPALAPLFRPSIQSYQMSELNEDPAKVAKALTVPLLLVQGSKAAKVSEADFAALKAARPDARTLLVPDMIHPLKIVRPDTAKPANGLAGLPIAPSVSEAVIAFVKGRRPIG